MEKSVEFSIAKITTEQFAVIDDYYFPEKEVELVGEFRFALIQKDKVISAFSQFRFQQSDKPFLVIEVGCHFKMKEDSWDQFKNGDKMVIEKGFMVHLLTIAVGTTRGVLHTKTESSRFNQYLLPTINVTDTVKEDFTVDLTP
jgi:hypothetical protein